MGNDIYQVDKLEVIEQQQQRAAEALIPIEKNSEASPVNFLRENYSNKRIRERSKDIDFKMMLSLALTKICAYAGIKDEGLSSFDAEDIIKMILSAYNSLTLEEVYKAFELERYGVYKDKTQHYQLFNAEYVSAVLKKYNSWKQITKIEHNIQPENKIPEMSDTQKKEIVNNGVLRVFNEYKETGIIAEPCTHVFDELYERGHIKGGETPALQAYYQKKYQQAQTEVEAEMKQETAGSVADLRNIREELEKIQQGASEKIIVRTKRIILSEYFDKLLKEKINVEELIWKI